MISVSCAIITHPNHPHKTLAVQRSPKMKHPLKWELPGGKIEAGESAEACIIREIKEELNVQIEVLKALPKSRYSYPSITVELHPFLVLWSDGEMVLSEHARAEFLSDQDFSALDWLEADLPIVEHYIQHKKGQEYEY